LVLERPRHLVIHDIPLPAVLGPGVRGLCVAAAAKEAGAGFVMVTGFGPRDAERLALASNFGADLAVDVAVEDPVAALQAGWPMSSTSPPRRPPRSRRRSNLFAPPAPSSSPGRGAGESARPGSFRTWW
jgi:hypothetical protein